MPTTVTDSLVDKFDRLRSDLRAVTVRLDVPIDGFLAGLVARANMLQLGPPGVGKSYLAIQAHKRLEGVAKFKHSFSKFSTDNDVMGGLSIPELKAGRPNVRVIKGYLPAAGIGILEEAGRANGPVLDCLLEIVHEGTFRQGGEEQQSALAMVVANSNSVLTAISDDMAAFDDRLLLRYYIDELTDPQDRRALLELDPDPRPAPILHWDEVLTAQDQARGIKVTSQAITAYIEILVALAELNVRPSPRRQRAALDVVRAWAWLAGETAADVASLDIVEHIMWSKPEQRLDVSKAVLGVCAPGVHEAHKALDQTIELTKIVATYVADVDNYAKSHGKGQLSEELMARSFEVVAKAKEQGVAVLALEVAARGRSATILEDVWRRLETQWVLVQQKGYLLTNPPSLRSQVGGPVAA